MQIDEGDQGGEGEDQEPLKACAGFPDFLKWAETRPTSVDFVFEWN